MKTCKECGVVKSDSRYSGRHTICKKCRADIERRRRAERKANGLCHHCQSEAINGLSVCEEHWWKKFENADELKTLLAIQDNKCPYTGDHIQPGSMVLDDGQWVSIAVANAKGNLSKEEFVTLCYKVVLVDDPAA